MRIQKQISKKLFQKEVNNNKIKIVAKKKLKIPNTKQMKLVKKNVKDFLKWLMEIKYF